MGAELERDQRPSAGAARAVAQPYLTEEGPQA